MRPSRISLTLRIDKSLGSGVVPNPLILEVYAQRISGAWNDLPIVRGNLLGVISFDTSVIAPGGIGTIVGEADLVYPLETDQLAELKWTAGTSYYGFYNTPESAVVVTKIDVCLEEGAQQCLIKPVKKSYKLGTPGVAGDPGRPGSPAYCISPPAATVGASVSYSVIKCSYQFVPTYCDPSDPFNTNPACAQSSSPEVDADNVPGRFVRVCTTTGGGSAAGPSGTFGKVVLQSKPSLICYPAVAAIPPTPAILPTPASMTIEYDEGWNYGGDIGIASFDFALGFSVPVGAAGVVVGLVQLGNNTGYLYPKYDHALYFTSTTFQVIENGVNRTPYIDYESSDTFEIRRSNGGVEYRRNGAVVYSSLKASSAPHVMAAYSMYRGGDQLCSPTISPINQYGAADSALPGLVSFSADKDYTDARGTLPPLTASGSGWMLEEVVGTLTSLVGFATDRADNYAQAMGALTLMTSEALGDFRLGSISTADGVISPVQTWSYGQSGQIGSGDAVLPAMATLASDYEYSFGDGSFSAMLGDSFDFFRFDSYLYGDLPRLEIADFHMTLDFQNYIVGTLEASLEGALYGGANLTGTLQRLEVMVLTGTVENIGRLEGDLPALTGSLGVITGVAGEIEGQLPVTLTGNLYGGAYITGDLPILTGLLGADVGSVGQIHGDLPALEVDSLTATIGIAGTLEGDLPELEALWGYLDGEILAVEGEFLANTVTVSEYVAWVMNLAHRGVTTYSAFPFEFLIRWQGRHLMANAAGIYELDGSGTQEGAIAASFKFPPNGFGTMQHKRPARAYLQGSLAGEMAVGVGADEGELYESHTSGHDGLDYWPVKLPRGVKGNHLEFEVSNVDGADFEIESVDLLVHLTGRKL